MLFRHWGSQSRIINQQSAIGLIYARAHDQTVADDYFAAMQRIEQRLEIASAESTEEGKYEIVKVPERAKAIQLTDQLALPELCLEERLDIVAQLRELFGLERDFAPPVGQEPCANCP